MVRLNCQATSYAMLNLPIGHRNASWSVHIRAYYRCSVLHRLNSTE